MWFSVARDARGCQARARVRTGWRRRAGAPVRSRRHAADRPPARVRLHRVRADPRPGAERAVRRDALADARPRRRRRDGRRQHGRRLRAGHRRRVRARRARAGVDRGLHRRSSWCGAAYLVFLGVQTFRHRRSLAAALDAPVEPKVLRRILADGFVVGMFNPKVIVFFMAVLPQFVDRSRGLGAAPAADARRDLLRDRAAVRQHVGAAGRRGAVVARLLAAPAGGDRRRRRPGHRRARRGAVAVSGRPKS